MNNNKGPADTNGANAVGALSLWALIFGDQTGPLALFSADRQEGVKGLQNPRSAYFNYPSEAPAAIARAMKMSEQGQESYFCPHLLTTPDRKKANAAQISTLYSDQDGAPIPEGRLKPTAVVESSPGRYHCYYKLTRPISPEYAEQLNKRLTRTVDGDDGGCKLAQLLRVPGTVNRKYGEPHTVRGRESDPERVFTPEDLDRLLPPIPGKETRRRTDTGERGESKKTAARSDAPPVELSLRGLQVWRGEHPVIKDGTSTIDRSRSLLKTVRPLYDAGADRATLVEALEERDRALGYLKYSGRPDAAKQYHAIVDELERTGRKPPAAFPEGPTGGATMRPEGQAEEPRKNKRSQTNRLVDYAIATQAELFLDQMHQPHALVAGVPVPLNSSRCYSWLRGLVWDAEGITVGGEALKTTAGTLAAFAERNRNMRELHTRAVFHEDAVYYQLRPGRVLCIDRDGYRIDPDPPVLFRSILNLKDLPDPESGGSLDVLDSLINLKTDRDKRTFKAYVATLPLANIPRPILQTTGVMGSGKTTAGRIIKRLLDPTSPETVRMDPRDFLQKASHAYIVMLDNLNTIPEWGVDTLCRLVTGEADSKRSLYTDDTDFIYELKRVVLLNGINAPTERGDAQDRTLPVELERIPDDQRHSEESIWAKFEVEHPRLLGAIFDTLARTLKEKETLQLSKRPRLADWGEYAAAAYNALGWGQEQFLEDWSNVVKVQTRAPWTVRRSPRRSSASWKTATTGPGSQASYTPRWKWRRTPSASTSSGTRCGRSPPRGSGAGCAMCCRS